MNLVFPYAPRFTQIRVYAKFTVEMIVSGLRKGLKLALNAKVMAVTFTSVNVHTVKGRGK